MTGQERGHLLIQVTGWFDSTSNYYYIFPIFRIFLSEHNGNPNKTNGHKHTCLHCVCMEKAEHSQVYPVMRRRAECLAMLLKWRGATLADNEIEKINMGAQDEVRYLY
jgi:hypothetical protein